MSNFKLTQFSPGAGCGCKISPKDLEKILHSHSSARIDFPQLLVGNESKDDAAVFDIGGGRAIISTTDFFTPIVDDPFDFGQIASVNAISDIYAMGGRPLMAIAILGWPLSKLPAEIASVVIEGARAVCDRVQIPLAGGHSIDIADPIFGLAVTGEVMLSNIKKNNTAQDGDYIFLSKPLGIGLLTTAEKFCQLREGDRAVALATMKELNSVGYELGKLSYVTAMTDVTGFGFLGHLLECCGRADICAQVDFSKIPKLPNVDYYIEKEMIPGGTMRNLASYEQDFNGLPKQVKYLLADPQTSGGLLFMVNANSLEDFAAWQRKHQMTFFQIGRIKSRVENNLSPITLAL
ncbi:MAG: selenide, water dikinase SelD [Bdellovibrionales bacterium RIFOXYD12_FULL_39_22]|nr:MAG: selenide, water dikinase SelD [Bdellovibrionales bacterium RIFOXYB1_FULL_39_21]OFZ42401.1 MAG: selenide, water dikinase SelD [Bdellovibrionales bacterium RIFOXYC12_FULL_39_17]OFZ46298.1 MAG: selenide, water dikinase SelD [Bdellovibrionales bacterium RIFOXYC1_FULL_39_130]OFZ75191.1 MAG: selenide, water dikinase SelD [Bdellovibrionales bacterium RIFOXYD1_FULL_39_84]OFZ93185.1 MAG: selenide, water dikinase SelD [Bdellovibrionales bacterium RIFOXYD12_FULL_39_22]HLE11104.1 selenide, water d